MGTKIDLYRMQIRETADLDAFLRRHSGLPGPRGNLELAHAFAREGDRHHIWRLSSLNPDEAPENTPGGFLAFCGVLGLGRLIAEGDAKAAARLRQRASDPRWRVREAAATALQMVGDTKAKLYAANVAALARGNSLEQRAAVAAVAEPRLLATEASVQSALRVLDTVTRSLSKAEKPLGEDARVLRKGLAYAWSVVVAANPALGKPAMETWLRSSDSDIVWVMSQNLTKNRLRKVEPAWCGRWLRALRPGRASPGKRTAGSPPPRKSRLT